MYFGLWFGLVEHNPELHDYLFCYCIGGEDDGFPKKYVDKSSKLTDMIVKDDWTIGKFDKYDLTSEDSYELIAKQLIETIEIMIK